MQKSLIPPKPKYRGQRISHTELVAEARQQLNEAGAGNHGRALFITELARNIVGNENPHFAQLQPRIKARKSEVWSRAYDLVLGYLKGNDLYQTFETVGIEVGSETTEVQPRKTRGSSNIGGIEDLVQTKTGKPSFHQRVDRYARESMSESQPSEQFSSSMSFSEEDVRPAQKAKPARRAATATKKKAGKRKTKTQNVDEQEQKQHSAKNSEPRPTKRRPTADSANEKPQPKKLTIIPPSRPLDDTIVQPTQHVSPFGKDILVEPTSSEQVPSPTNYSKKLPPMQQPTEKEKEELFYDKASAPKPLSPTRGEGVFTKKDKQSKKQTPKSGSKGKQQRKLSKMSINQSIEELLHDTDSLSQISNLEADPDQLAELLENEEFSD